MSLQRLVIGVGNVDRGDDGVGPAAARALEKKAPAEVTVIVSHGEPGSLIDQWSGVDAVFVVDACAGGAAPGTIRRFVAAEGPLPEFFGAVSTHGFGVGAAVELARAIDALPELLIIYGIEADCFDPGQPLSPLVAEAADEVAARILDELTRLAA